MRQERCVGRSLRLGSTSFSAGSREGAKCCGPVYVDPRTHRDTETGKSFERRDLEVLAVGWSDVTAMGVRRALAEFDALGRRAFLAKYGFGKARVYFLVRDGVSYDSKAIVGVAHGYDLPDLGPLQSQGLSGGRRVVSHLKSLGFEVIEVEPTNWVQEEVILLLELYLREFRPPNVLPDERHPSVKELSERLNSFTFHPEHARLPSFRNPTGVAMKLANLAWIDPEQSGGLDGRSDLDVKMWNRYEPDRVALLAAAAAIREAGRLPAVPIAKRIRPTAVNVRVRARHVEQFQVSVPGQDRKATQDEAELVEAFIEHLGKTGRHVTGRKYLPVGSSHELWCDLMDTTNNVLYEAKGDVLRPSVRMAIGQLLDYRRFEETSPSLAVLLPERPTQDLISLIHAVPASVVWWVRKTRFEYCPPSHATTDDRGCDEDHGDR